MNAHTARTVSGTPPPVALHRIALADCLAQPWKNGGGQTRELLVWPAAAAWALRISVATIDRDGPFSSFEGIERWFAVIDGPGVRLQWPSREGAGGPTRGLACHVGDAPIVFDGADPPAAQLMGAPSTDFNLMVRRSAGRALLVNAHAGQPCPFVHRWRGVFVNRAAWLRGPVDVPLRLAAGTLAYAERAAVPASASAMPDPAWVLDAVDRSGPADDSGATGSLGWWVGFDPTPCQQEPPRSPSPDRP